MKHQILNPFEHLIWLVLLAGLVLALSSCAPVGVSQDPAGKQFPPTPEVPTLVSSAPASPTAARPPAAVTPTLTPGSNGPLAGWKTFSSSKYSYTMSYPANWTIKVQTAGPAGPGRDQEYVFLTPPGSGLPQVQILALRGVPPITGFENCNKNLQFRGIPACSISVPGRQQPPTQMLLFQKGDAYFHMAIQYEAQSQLAVFDDIVKSFQFTQ